MKLEKVEERIDLPDGVTASFEKRRITVTGPKGELSREIIDPALTITCEDGTVTIVATKVSMREKKRLFTWKAHIKNLLKGVSDGFTYTLKICSGHFPMSVSVKGRKFEVKNFIGEKVPRILMLKEGSEVKVDGDTVTVEGLDKEIVGQVAADIEQLTKRPGFDNRIFQDGIFIVDKDGKSMS